MLWFASLRHFKLDKVGLESSANWLLIYRWAALAICCMCLINCPTSKVRYNRFYGDNVNDFTVIVYILCR